MENEAEMISIRYEKRDLDQRGGLKEGGEGATIEYGTRRFYYVCQIRAFPTLSSSSSSQFSRTPPSSPMTFPSFFLLFFCSSITATRNADSRPLFGHKFRFGVNANTQDIVQLRTKSRSHPSHIHTEERERKKTHIRRLVSLLH